MAISIKLFVFFSAGSPPPQFLRHFILQVVFVRLACNTLLPHYDVNHVLFKTAILGQNVGRVHRTCDCHGANGSHSTAKHGSPQLIHVASYKALLLVNPSLSGEALDVTD